MKTKVLLTALTTGLSALLATSQASASWFQSDCSNGEATVQVLDGHDANGIVLTERVWGRGETGHEDTKLNLDPRDAKIAVLEEKPLFKRENKGCADTASFGWYSLKEVSYRRVNISKADGSPFSENTVGVSQDRKTVEAFLVCERFLTSEMPCK